MSLCQLQGGAGAAFRVPTGQPGFSRHPAGVTWRAYPLLVLEVEALSAVLRGGGALL